MKSITLATTLFLVAILQVNKAKANEDIEQIKEVIQWYFDGTSQGKPELVKKAFLPTLELQYVTKEGQFKRWLGDNYISGIKKGMKNGRVGETLAIDMTGDSAMAKATIIMNETVFTDYFLLLKLDSGWKIANKIFTRQQVKSVEFKK